MQLGDVARITRPTTNAQTPKPAKPSRCPYCWPEPGLHWLPPGEAAKRTATRRRKRRAR